MPAGSFDVTASAEDVDDVAQRLDLAPGTVSSVVVLDAPSGGLQVVRVTDGTGTPGGTTTPNGMPSGGVDTGGGSTASVTTDARGVPAAVAAAAGTLAVVGAIALGAVLTTGGPGGPVRRRARGMILRSARTLAAAAGTLVLLAGPAVLGDVLADDGGGTVSAGPPVVGAPTGEPVPAPADAVSVPPDRTDIPAVPAAPRPAPVGVVAAAAPSPPVHLTIPAVEVSTGLEGLGVRPDGTLAPPADFATAGWFAGGVEPGQPGPAVIAGHVDSAQGPAVFYRLGELGVGDEIDVGRADGSSVRFRVTGVTEHPKDAFPTEAVYGPVAGSELRLITCSGTFDEGTGHYLSNLVVFATLA